MTQRSRPSRSAARKTFGSRNSREPRSSTGFPAYGCHVRPESTLVASACACRPSPSTLVYTATSGGPHVGTGAAPNPEVFPWSTTTEPEKTCSPARYGSATGCSVHVSRSGLVAWPQLMLPQSAPSGLYWKKRWYSPSTNTSPLGSFIQLRAGVKWNRGRYGSLLTPDPIGLQIDERTTGGHATSSRPPSGAASRPSSIRTPAAPSS